MSSKSSEEEEEIPAPPPRPKEEIIAEAAARSQQRYADSRAKYKKYFMQCLNEIEALQPTAFSAVQVSRMFTIGVLPKYCVIKDPLTPKQRKRLEFIMRG